MVDFSENEVMILKKRGNERKMVQAIELLSSNLPALLEEMRRDEWKLEELLEFSELI